MKKRLPRYLRFLRTTLLFLLLGAILNVAVAWGCVFAESFSTKKDKQTLDHNTMPIRIKDLHNSLLPSDIVDADPLYGLGTHFGYRFYSISSAVMEWDISQDPVKVTVKKFAYIGTFIHESGWPFQSLWGYIFCESRDGIDYPTLITTRKEFGQYWFNLAPVGINRQFRLPIYVRWWATAGNTLFYAVILWLPYQGFFMWRRHRRIQRGRCGQCGYIVAPNIGVPGASPNCPECGTPLPKKRINTSSE